MPKVKQLSRYVIIAYELCCGFEMAAERAEELCKRLMADDGISTAEDDTRGWDGNRMACVKVWYRSLADANRLDATVRQLLAK